MKNIAKSLVVAGAVAVAGSVNADVFADLNPFIGVDYQQTWMKGKESNTDPSVLFGKGQAPKSYPGASIYVGTKFMENVGVEAGFDWTTNKKKNFVYNAFGAQIGANTKVRRTGFHFDLIGFLPVADCTELFASIGAGWVKPKITFTPTTWNGAAITAAQLARIGETGVTSKAKAVLRLGVGASYMITDMIGVRGKLGYETTSRLRAKGNSPGSKSVKAFKNSQTLNVGAFVRF